ncbi:MAG: glycerophosphodiester phosphodiesterase family protein [Pseudomonadota bacterium]
MTTHPFHRIRLLPVAFALLTMSAAAHAELPQLNGQAPIVIAHRGASGYLPEHTLGGYELAVKLGADYIEPDLQLTKDGYLVAMHDATLTRTTNVSTLFAPRNGTYRVADFTLAEVKTLTVKPVGSAATTYPGFTPISTDPYRIPTFDEVIALARSLGASTGREIGIYPEAKQADPAMEDKILATLVAKGYTGTDKVFIQSFSADTISSIHDKQALLGVDFNLLVLSSSSNALVTYGLDKIRSFADGIGVSIGGAGMSESFIDLAHDAGLLVHGYTFSKTGSAAATEYAKFFGWGMDGVFSNYTDLAITARDGFVAAQIPEPGTYALLLAGLGAIGVVARRRKV